MTMLQRCMDYYTLWLCNLRLYHVVCGYIITRLRYQIALTWKRHLLRPFGISSSCKKSDNPYWYTKHPKVRRSSLCTFSSLFVLPDEESPGIADTVSIVLRILPAFGRR